MSRKFGYVHWTKGRCRWTVLWCFRIKTSSMGENSCVTKGQNFVYNLVLYVTNSKIRAQKDPHIWYHYVDWFAISMLGQIVKVNVNFHIGHSAPRLSCCMQPCPVPPTSIDLFYLFAWFNKLNEDFRFSLSSSYWNWSMTNKYRNRLGKMSKRNSWTVANAFDKKNIDEFRK